nr:glycosyltransferase [candidate division Zixibacteria bacterium]
MEPRKRLLIITNRYPGGPDDAASPFVYDFRLALERVNIEVDIVTPYYRTYADNNDYLDEHVHLFPWSDGSRVISQLPLYNPVTFIKIRRYFRNGYRAALGLTQKKKYSGVVALWAAPSGYMAMQIRRQCGIPYAVWALGSDINSWANLPIAGRMIRRVLIDADALYADGYELATRIRNLVERECRFIPSFHAITLPEIKAESKDKIFCCVGRIEKNKGVFDLLEAFKIFSQKHPDWKLIYIGSGRDEKELAEKTRSLNPEVSVSFNGYLPRNEVNRILAGSRAAIIPSHTDSLPLTFGEAMQAGIPVVCSDIGDMPFLIDTHRVGYHFPAGDVGRLAECLARMADSVDDFSANCKAVREELDIANAAREISRWLDTHMNNRPEVNIQHANA